MTDDPCALQNATQLTQGKIWDAITTLAHRPDRIRFINDHQDLIRCDAVSELAAMIPRLVISEASKALPVAEIALDIARRLGDVESLAKGLRAKANALYGLRRNKAAISYHSKAIAIFRKLNDPEQIARTLSSSIQPLILLGHYDHALSAAKEAQMIFEKQGNHWRVARLGLNVGNIYQRQYRIEVALECYKEAFRSLAALSDQDPEAFAAALHNIAVSYRWLNDYARAMEGFQQARIFALTHHMPAFGGQVDYNIGELHYLRGDYHHALSMLKGARDTCSSTGDLYHVSLCNLVLSEIYLEFKMGHEALDAATSAAASFRILGMRYERAKAVMNMAEASEQEGDTGRALRTFLQARRMFAREKNRAYVAIIDLSRAVVLVHSRRQQEAHALCVAAMVSFRALKIKPRMIECHLLLARLSLEGDALLAEKHCKRALRLLPQVPSPIINCRAYTMVAQVHESAGHEKRSYEAYKRARCSLEGLRDSIHIEELRIAFMKDRVEIYEALISHCMRYKRQPKATLEAIKYIQEAKSRSLLDFLPTAREISWRETRAVTETSERILELRKELNSFYREVDSAQLEQLPKQAISALQSELESRERQLLRLSREYSYDQEGRSWSVALTVDQIRGAIPQNSVILEYFQIKDRIVVLLLSETLLEIVELADCSEITTLLQGLDFQLSKVHLGQEYGRVFADVLLKSVQTHLNGLYRALFEPIHKRLVESHLVIAPHGVLHRLPFQALFSGHEYLIDEFVISYAPSASVYALSQERSTHRNGKSLILGIPDGATPHFQEEVISVASCLPRAEVLLGADATVERLREKGRESQYIHIATHGHFRVDNPMFSRIELGGSYLSLYDLYQLELPAELITLSGCSTGQNVVAAGDELLGLARGLIHAGAETSLLTLWDVQDNSAAQIMTIFYQQLGGGAGKPKALQHAMQQVRSAYPHPYHWAPFNLVGKG
jgi:CHAT domain-containing protein